LKAFCTDAAKARGRAIVAPVRIFYARRFME
jgi:hypothetical protein